MFPVGAICVSFPPKTDTNLLHPRPAPQSLNGSSFAADSIDISIPLFATLA